MKSAWLCLATALGLGFGSLGGCGGDSQDSSGSTAGKSGGGTSTNAGNAGMSEGGTSAATGGSGAGGSSAGDSGLGECAKAECGPQLGIPNWTCADGTVGGPTGRCLKRPGGACGWEINNCPMAGTGGAASQGGQGNASGEAVGGAPANGCGVCSPGTVCVFQLGGPGPSHFLCAKQNPCGAAAACACIVGQGACQPNLVGDPPGYCSCDNGLE